MDIQKVKELALANGFSLKLQASGNMDLNAYVYDFANAIEREVKAQAVPEWISVDDRLPNRQVNVLVASKHDFVCIASLTNNHKNNKFYDGDGLAINSITHWMPLPDAPQEPAND